MSRCDHVFHVPDGPDLRCSDSHYRDTPYSRHTHVAAIESATARDQNGYPVKSVYVEWDDRDCPWDTVEDDL